jgi:hypothetical protein
MQLILQSHEMNFNQELSDWKRFASEILHEFIHGVEFVLFNVHFQDVDVFLSQSQNRLIPKAERVFDFSLKLTYMSVHDHQILYTTYVSTFSSFPRPT